MHKQSSHNRACKQASRQAGTKKVQTGRHEFSAEYMLQAYLLCYFLFVNIKNAFCSVARDTRWFKILKSRTNWRYCAMEILERKTKSMHAYWFWMSSLKNTNKQSYEQTTVRSTKQKKVRIESFGDEQQKKIWKRSKSTEKKNCTKCDKNQKTKKNSSLFF